MKEESNKFIESPIVYSIANEIPVIRTVVNYWKDKIRKNRDIRINRILNETINKLEELEKNQSNLIDKKHLSSSDFLLTVEQIVEISIHTIDETKLEYLKKFLINYSYHSRPDTNEKEIFLNLISQLSGMHIVILDKLFNHQNKLSITDLNSLRNQENREEIVFFEDLIRNVNPDGNLVKLITLTLQNFGLIYISNSTSKNPYFILEPIGFKLLEFLNKK